MAREFGAISNGQFIALQSAMLSPEDLFRIARSFISTSFSDARSREWFLKREESYHFLVSAALQRGMGTEACLIKSAIDVLHETALTCQRPSQHSLKGTHLELGIDAAYALINRLCEEILGKHPTPAFLPVSGIALTPKKLKQETATQSKIKSAAPDTEHMSGEAKAVAVLITHPDWTNKQIAKAVGCHPKTLNKWNVFRSARAILRAGKLDLLKGIKGRDRSLDAWDEDREEDSRDE
jgi:hypothetical protein